MAPVRTCIGCRTARPATELVRCALGSDGQVILDRTAPGRGAWLCPERACLAAAIRRNGFDRAFKRKLSAGATDDVEEKFENPQTACGS